MRTSPSRAAAPRPAALALVLFILGGCGSGDGETCRVEQPLEACAIAPGTGLSRPSANPAPEPTDCTGLSEECLLPFPSAAFLREDESTPSGRRLAAPPALAQLGVDPLEVERGDGFSRVSPIVTRLPGGVSQEGLPSMSERVAAYHDSVADDSPIFIVDADAASPEYGVRVPFVAEAFASEEQPDESLLILTPLELLAPSRRYAVVVTSRVLDRCGHPSVPGEETRALFGEDRPAGPLGARWDAAQSLRHVAEVELGLAPCEIVQLWDFWTRSDEDATRDLLSMREAALDWLALSPPEPEITLAETGTDGVTRVEFTYASPSFRIDAASGLARDGEGLPTIEREETLHGILLLPPEASEESPVPAITLGHGFGMDREQMCALAKSPVIGRGAYAIGCFDWDLHGARGGGADAILSLLGPSTLPSLASVFQQSAIDELVFSESLRALAADAALEGRVDISRHLYAGVSMGGVVGTLSTAIDDAMDASVLNVPGGGIVHLVRHSALFDTLDVRGIVREVVVGSGSVTGLPVDLEVELIIALSQFALDEADPAVWGEHLVVDRLVPTAPPVLMQQSIGDGVVPNFTTELLARAASLPLVEPYQVEVPGLEVVSSPTLGDPPHGLAQFRFAASGFVAHLVFAHASVQAQLYAFLDSVLDEDPDNDGDIRFP